MTKKYIILFVIVVNLLITLLFVCLFGLETTLPIIVMFSIMAGRIAAAIWNE